MDAWNFIAEWWKEYQPDPRSEVENIKSGLKKQQTSSDSPPTHVDPAVKGSLQTASCQYWVKGLPSVCSNWDGGKMECGIDTSSIDLPTGYGLGGCDGLGRRQWCSRYSEPVDPETGESASYDPDAYACVLPCIERAGTGKVQKFQDGIQIIPWKPEEIIGYNPDDGNVGQCDGQGMGRGVSGFNETFIENIQLHPMICKQYRPPQMGFGAVDPRPYHGSPPSSMWKDGQTYIPRTPRELHDGSQADPLVQMTKRLPFAFDVYNIRSRFQKCAHWDSDFGAYFSFDETEPDPSMWMIDISASPKSFCKLYNRNALVQPFCNPLETEDIFEVPFILWFVWSEAGSIICNGAKPECPCYTGRWTYCTDRNMQDGMRISADQIFEMRFWASDWSSQDEYDKYYAAKPGITQEGFGDITTADIYTFTHWETLDAVNASNSIMAGNKHHMCMPAPLHMREYDTGAYITITPITYPKAGENLGTTSVEEAAFPTLVRQLELPENLLPDIMVIYPYSNEDPWADVPCSLDDSQEPYIHCNNLMYGEPKIMVVGSCLRQKKVWAINASYVNAGTSSISGDGVFSIMKLYPRAQKIPEDRYAAFCAQLKGVITHAENHAGDGIVSGYCDDYGFFHMDNLALNNNKMNDIFVICEWRGGDTPEYVYRYREVESRYFGALISQRTFDHAYQGDVWENYTPDFFTPAGSIQGNVGSIGGEVGEMFPCYSLYMYGIMADVAFYTYCINAYEEEDADLEQWVQIGPTGYIWAEIPEVRISYLWDFIVTEASISAKPVDDYDPIDNPNPTYRASLCGLDAEDHNEAYFKLEVVEVTQDIRKTMPASAVILKAKDSDGNQMPRDFFNKDWKLNIKYVYTRLEPFMGEAVVFPGGGLTSYSLNRFMESPYQVLHEPGETTFEIPMIGGIGNTATPAVMALVNDDHGRTQAAAATKMLLQGHRLTCRSVDIFYSYRGDATGYDLEPSTGFFTWRGSPSVSTSTKTGIVHSRVAKCGDHECNASNCIGPMWFPFNNCTTIDYYNVHNGAAQCTMPISEGAPHLKVMGFAAWRYCMADEYKGWVTTGGNWASACGTAFYYHYSQANPASMQFTGWAKRKGQVDKWFYIFREWALPPFGNTGRAMIERWVIRDFASFVDLSSGQPVPKLEYMPMVLDREDVISNLDCFANPGLSSHPNLGEPFSHRSMMSNLISNDIGEVVEDGTRYRFDEVIEPEYHGDCMYPWPALTGAAGSTRVIRYKFKSASTAWIWPEYWREIERNVEGKGKFSWLELKKPEYYYDANKQQHRLITAEGQHKVMFKPPAPLDQTTAGEDSPGSTFGSISLDGEHWRFFEMLYDDYTGGKVDWNDESAGGEDGGSGGDGDESEEGNIYEEANNGEGQNWPAGGAGNDPIWMHDFDTLFDPEASAEPNEDRKALLGQDPFTGENIEGYFNRGLIATIVRSKLHLLPMEEISIAPGTPIEGEFGVETDSAIVTQQVGGDQPAPTKLLIRGVWGVSGNESEGTLKYTSQPGIDYGESYDEIGDGPQDWPGTAYSQAPKSGKNETLSMDYSIEIELSKYPDRILKKPTYFQIRLTPAQNETIYVTSIEAIGSMYAESEETITVWEQMYSISTLELGGNTANADGPDTKTYRDRDYSRKNAGQYLPTSKEGLWPEEGSCRSKMSVAAAGKYYGIDEDEKIEVSKGSLKTVERDEQKFLYEEAIKLDSSDRLSFSGFYPPDIHYFLLEVLGSASGGSGSLHPSSCSLTHNKIPWDKNWHNYRLNQEGDFFSPGGHYFKWSDSFFRTRCYLFGPVETVYRTSWIHHLHAKGEESTPTAGEAYAGWVRLAYYEGRLAQLNSLGQYEHIGQPTDALSGAKNGTYKQS